MGLAAQKGSAELIKLGGPLTPASLQHLPPHQEHSTHMQQFAVIVI